MNQNKKDAFYIKMAEMTANDLSKDFSTKVGSVIVGQRDEIISSGYNGLPRGVIDNPDTHPERFHDRPKKYHFAEHAERNALYNALHSGRSVAGCTMYLNFEPYPCHDCTRGVIQSGITEVVGPDRSFTGKGNQWSESLQDARDMLEEAGIITRIVPFDIILKYHPELKYMQGE